MSKWPGSIEENLKGPLTDALQQYRDGPDGLDEAILLYLNFIEIC